MSVAEKYHFNDFTLGHYESLLELALEKGYHFEPYGTTQTAPHILWRHDIDFSVERSLNLAKIEAAQGIQATYFVLPHSEYYNLLEKVTFRKMKEILALGHHLGLHFDPSFYGAIRDDQHLEEVLGLEKQFFETLFQLPIQAFSYHNPDVGNGLSFRQDKIAGMWNAYGEKLQKQYRYCSDSNGYWRFDRLFDVLNGPQEPRLHILTHAIWWVESPMSPFERIVTSIDAKSEALKSEYVTTLKTMGRQNIAEKKVNFKDNHTSLLHGLPGK